MRTILDQAWAALDVDRLERAWILGEHAADAAGSIGDASLWVAAQRVQAEARRRQGRMGEAVGLYASIVAAAEDPKTRHAFDRQGAHAVLAAYVDTVVCVMRMTESVPTELLGLLDDAENWLADIGRGYWRSAIQLRRAEVLDRLGDLDAAIVCAEEALADRNRGFYDDVAHRARLANLLVKAGRHQDAEHLYLDNLDDPTATQYRRLDSHEGLVRCAVAAGDPRRALLRATSLVQHAEPLGDTELRDALNVLLRAYATLRDSETASQEIGYCREMPEIHANTHARYVAAWTAVVISLQRKDVVAAANLVDELRADGRVLDNPANDNAYTRAAMLADSDVRRVRWGKIAQRRYEKRRKNRRRR